MSRQQRFDWFLSQGQSRHKRRLARNSPSSTSSQQVSRQRFPRFESLESRELLSVNSGQLSNLTAASPAGSVSLESTAANTTTGETVNTAFPISTLAHDHNGDGIPDHSAADHESGCCCEQCTGALTSYLAHDHNGDGIPDHSAADHEPGCCCEQCTGVPGTSYVLSGAYYPAPPEGEPLPLDVHQLFEVTRSPRAAELAAQAAAVGGGSIAAATAGVVDPPTVIFDFIEAGEPNSTDIFNNVLTTFDFGAYGFAPEQFDELTELIVEEVRSDYLDILTSDIFPQSPIPPGQELNIQFEIGNVGDLPVNGSSDFYYVQIGSGVSGPFLQALGVAGLSTIRNADGGGAGINVGEVVSSVFTDTIQGIGGISPFNALQSGDFEFTANAIARVLAHEVGHAVSLDHVAQAGVVTPTGLPAILGTGAIDTPNQSLLVEGEFAVTGFNPEAGGRQQFQLNQLVSALGLVDAGTSPRVTPGIIVDILDDENDGNFDVGDLSLREALELAALQPGTQTIGFSASFADIEGGANIQLDSSLGSLLITEEVNIQGLGSDILTLTAPVPGGVLPIGDNGQIFVIGTGDVGELPFLSAVTISDLTLTGANTISDGGAIFSSQAVVLEEVVLQENTTIGAGGGIFTTADLEIRSSSLIGNNADIGGGAMVTGNLVIEESTITGNSASSAGGGVRVSSNDGTITVQSSSIVDNTVAMGDGGGLQIYGNSNLINIRETTLSGNQAGVGVDFPIGDGGGLQINGYTNGIVIESSTLSGNSAGSDGGGLQLKNNSGTFEDGNDLLILSSTISGNTSVGNGGGVHLYDFDPFQLRILHSTIANNEANGPAGSGGGVYTLNGSLLVDHSIIAGNTAAPGAATDIDNINPFIDPVTPPTAFANFSLIGSGGGANIDQLTGNIIGNLVPINPGLGELQDNGGATFTHLLLESSPALDGGNPNIPLPPDFEQRGVGFQRIINNTIDIGAVELDGFTTTYTVDTLVDENDGNVSVGNLSLREALAMASSIPGLVLIDFAPQLSGGTLMLDPTLGELEISSSVSINASNLLSGLTIDASSADITPNLNDGNGQRLFKVDDNNAETLADVSLIGLTLQGGDVNQGGGAILSNENLTLQFVSLIDNAAAGDGGGVFHQNGGLVIENSTIANNTARGDGSTGQSNGISQPGAGGGVWINTLSLDPNDPTFDPGSLTARITNSTISGNHSISEGAGIFNFNGLLTIENATITNNEATAALGGGVISFGALGTETTVYSSIIADNRGFDPDPAVNQLVANNDVQISEGVTPLAGNTFTSLGFNLIGGGNALLEFSGNFDDSTDLSELRLGLLADNGGPTLTHALLPGSSAIDASDPNVILNGEPEEGQRLVSEFDQRGEPFSRLTDGDLNESILLDIGAFEAPVLVPSGDLDGDGDTDGADFLSWQRSFSTTDPNVTEGGDADFDGDVDADDLNVWQQDFGGLTPTPSSPLSGALAPASNPTAVLGKEPMSKAISNGLTVPVNMNSATLLPAVAAQYDLFQRALGSLDDRPVVLRDNAGKVSASSAGRPSFVLADSVTVDSLTLESRSAIKQSAAYQSLDTAFERYDYDLSTLLEEDELRV